MCRKLIGVVWVFVLLVGFKASADQYAFIVYFRDKNNTPYSLGSPSAYLSTRALARRSTQSIAIDSSDIPANKVYVDSVLSLTGGVFHESSRWLNLCVVLLTDSNQI